MDTPGMEIQTSGVKTRPSELPDSRTGHIENNSFRFLSSHTQESTR